MVVRRLLLQERRETSQEAFQPVFYIPHAVSHMTLLL